MKPTPRNWALKVSTFVVVTACFVVMGAALLTAHNFKRLLTLWGEDVQMTVYLSQDLTEKGREEIETKLKATGKVGEITLVNQEKALSDFRTQLASYAPDISQDEELLRLIPASLQVRLSSEVATAEQMTELKNIADVVKNLQGVDEVSYGQEWIEKYASLVLAIETTLRILSLVIVLAALFVISNAIRASIQGRKEEIIVLEMIGATSTMIRKPFLLEGAALGLGASVLALFLCFSLYLGLKNLLIAKLSFLQLGEHLSFLGPAAAVLFIAGGTCLGGMASYLCIRRLNDGYAGSQG